MDFGSSSSLKIQEFSRRDRFLSKAAFLVIAFVASSVFYVWCRAEVVKTGRDLHLLTTEIDNVKTENVRLQTERDTLGNFKRIEEYARVNLGMVYPDSKRIKTVRAQ